MKRPFLTIIDPREEARVLAFHLGREADESRPPLIPALEAARELRTAEVEFIMEEVPS